MRRNSAEYVDARTEFYCAESVFMFAFACLSPPSLGRTLPAESNVASIVDMECYHILISLDLILVTLRYPSKKSGTAEELVCRH